MRERGPCFRFYTEARMLLRRIFTMKKMISRRNFLAAAGVVAAAGVLTACGGSSNSTAASASTAASGAAASGDTIKVGVLGPLTGDVSVYGQAVVNGATLYLKQVNERAASTASSWRSSPWMSRAMQLRLLPASPRCAIRASPLWWATLPPPRLWHLLPRRRLQHAHGHRFRYR